jgi:hypothetical protein
MRHMEKAEHPLSRAEAAEAAQKAAALRPPRQAQVKWPRAEFGATNGHGIPYLLGLDAKPSV